MRNELLFAAMYVAAVGAVAGGIFWALRRLGSKPSFIICCAISIVLLALLANFVATFPWR
jgi:hypothetical protein